MIDTGSHYTVLARRCRPQTFDEVVGQERIGQALRNAIRSGRVAHAYLFTGARGVGKTSTARILAKALNCPNVQDAVPCNDCEICRSIAAGSDVDVLEIDGASNRGIDDIRSLRANVTIKAMRSPYKVYIIDEVHMLTKEAFNALLKTLEEPPPNVKFVFCTTEPNKVPDTILSRCQRFDFGTIAASSIQARLQQIAEGEKVQVEPAALELLARRAAGSMRDSQSLFDQLLAFGGDPITADDVHQLLGTASDDRLVELVEAMIDRRRDVVLASLEASLTEGVQTGSLSDQLLQYLRDLMVVVVGADAVALQSVSEAQRPRVTEQAQRWGLPTITAALQVMAETKGRMQRGSYDRALLELAVIRLSLLEELTSIGELLNSSGAGGRPTAPSNAPVVQQTRRKVNPVLPLAPSLASSPAPEARQVVKSTPPESPASPQVEFTESSKVHFWSEVVSRLPDKSSLHLKNVTSIAIIGPNRLEVSFPPSYFLSKQFCERAETRTRVEEIATQLAGRPIEFAVGTTDVPVPAAASATRNSVTSSRKRPGDLDKDPFVQQALAIFGGRIEDVRQVLESTGNEEG